jgi:energy-coupling factor transporter ATP-binding protein EcfA2
MEAKTLEFSETPYPGLRPFRADEADIFFGRERQTDDLLARLAAHRFLAVVGPSGCGKSSLVAAGLMPALATGFMATAGAHWRIAKLRPGERPMANLAAALVEARVLDDERAAQPDAPVFLEAALRRGPLGLAEIVRGAAFAPDANLLVLVDQFEELFRFSAGVQRDEAEAFVALLLASAAAPRQRIYIAITMRSDFLGECAPFHGLPEAINDGLYLTPRLTRDECAACITGPARVFDADVEPTLVNRLLNDFGPDPDQLPLLQHALLRMWDRHEPDRQSEVKAVLGVADYDAIGGLARSLSDHADEAFDELAPNHQRIARLMFQRLSDSETARRDRRAPAHVGEIAELAGASIDDVRRVADVFRRRDRCFLVPREGIELTPDTILDVSHESLLRQWNRAVGWIAEEAEAVVAYRRLREATRAWRDGEPLMTAASLDRALVWRSRATDIWALRYAPREDFRAVSHFLDESQRTREMKRLRQVRARTVRLRRSIATIALSALLVGGLLAWVGWPLCYRWEHTSYYASPGHRNGAPYGLRELTRDQILHRPLSYRIVTAGRFGRVLRMEAVSSNGELAEVEPDYRGMDRGRRLTTSRWVYEYDAAGRIASEHQYTSSNRLTQSKIYLSRDDGDSRYAVFVDADGTPTPVQGRSSESVAASTYYWAERLVRSNASQGEAETIRYFGLSGERATDGDRAPAKQRVYDERGYLVSIASLDASGHLMNDAAGNAIFITKLDQLGNEVELLMLDKDGHRTRQRSGWSMRRATFDALGLETEESYFDEDDRPIITMDGWHKATITRNARGSITEIRYFDVAYQPTTDSDDCYRIEEQHDAMDRLTRLTCADESGIPKKNHRGFFTWIWRYDDRGRLVEQTIADADGHPEDGTGLVATELYEYDQVDRRVRSGLRNAHGNPTNSAEGYSGSIISHDDANRIELTRFLGVDGKPVTSKEGYAAIRRRRDARWNLIEQSYLDEHGDLTTSTDGSAGWQSTFDASGQEVERVLIDMAGHPMVGQDGYSILQQEYDHLGRMVAAHYLDPTKQPVINQADEVAGWRARYDTWGNKLECIYLGTDGEPIKTIHGEASWRAEYDRLGYQTRIQYFDTQGEPALHAWDDQARFTGRGYTVLTRKFDPHGRVLETAHFGLHHERLVPPDDRPAAR